MKIQILHNSACGFWQTAKNLLEEVLWEKGITESIEEVFVSSDEEAIHYRFAGSPQILIDGKDIDPMAEKIINFHESGCRFYIWQDKVYEYPPKKMIEEVLNKEN